MYQLHATVGEHRVLFEVRTDEHRVNMARTFGGSPEDRGQSGKPDLWIRVGEHCGHPFNGFHVDVSVDAQNIRYTRTDYTISANRSFDKVHVCGYDDFALKHALLHAFSMFLAHRKWGLMLQSVCLIRNDRAVVAAGNAAVKSSLIKHASPHLVLSDEATLIRVSAGKATIYDSPFRSGLWLERPVQPSPLESVAILLKSDRTKRVTLKKADALLRVANHLFIWPYDKQVSGQVLALCKELVDCVPVNLLHYKHEETLREWLV